jgi:glutamate synthase domain-containing protein 2
MLPVFISGITTQDPVLMSGLHIPTKAERVARFHAETVHTAMEITGKLDDDGRGHSSQGALS